MYINTCLKKIDFYILQGWVFNEVCEMGFFMIISMGRASPWHIGEYTNVNFSEMELIHFVQILHKNWQL